MRLFVIASSPGAWQSPYALTGDRHVVSLLAMTLTC